ncbi:phosphoribosylformylglycinamidine synthase subunit PurL [bacterium]|nr:phosphoribosylformylglycinamidine synthase subunit PurL [bacterium]
MLTATEITPEIVATHGLRPEEYDHICEILGRTPGIVELGIFSVMWSEHCAYKHSRPVLKTLPTQGERVLVGPGENAGIIDIGDGVCVAFKMESHNHPSAVEPYQGAATGVGGILRDIFTMGARPIAMLNNLRFGEPDDPNMQHLIDGVIEGIAGYGNCVGVPTVAGDIAFDPGYAGNILVNVMCVGVGKSEDIARGQATGAGNAVLYFGSPTGRDGIHGATFASEELNEEAVERRGAVQVGDPFMGKKILEATLELIERGLVVGIQDMGAAGLTCSTCEMAGRAGTGIDIDLDKVPQRAAAMSAYEIMLSESQERMLAVCEPARVSEALEVCERWECGGVVIGEVTDSGHMVVRHRGGIVADIPAAPLTEEAPVYHPESDDPILPQPVPTIPTVERASVGKWLLRLLASPTVASKRWAWRRYDHMVQTNTVVRPGDGDAAVLRVRGEGKHADKFIAVTGDGNARWVARDARLGGQLAVSEAARNLVCVGAEPVGLTNCLNFGSPEKPKIFGAFKNCVAGMGYACRRLNVPVTGGNVSLYNEHDGIAVPPTPMIGMVGLIEDAAHITRSGFRQKGDSILLLGARPLSIDGSEFAKLTLGPDMPGKPPIGGSIAFDLEEEARLQAIVLEAIRAGLVHSAHDVTEGGLAVALAECCLSSPHQLGAWIEQPNSVAPVTWFFGELPPRIILSGSKEKVGDIQRMADEVGVPCAVIGEVAAEALRLGKQAEITIDELRRAHETKPFEGLR